MDITLTINGEERRFEIAPGETPLEALRGNGYVGVKHGARMAPAARAPFCWTAGSFTRASC